MEMTAQQVENVRQKIEAARLAVHEVLGALVKSGLSLDQFQLESDRVEAWAHWCRQQIVLPSVSEVQPEPIPEPTPEPAVAEPQAEPNEPMPTAAESTIGDSNGLPH